MSATVRCRRAAALALAEVCRGYGATMPRFPDRGTSPRYSCGSPAPASVRPPP